MLPITRATLQHFCRVCLRELPRVSSTNTTEPNHCIEKDEFYKILHLISGIKTKGNYAYLFPQTICHSCYIKANALKLFRDRSLVATGVLKMLMTENLQKDTISKLHSFCRLCLKRQSKNISTNTEIYMSIKVCIGLELNIDESDQNDILRQEEDYPKYICSKCYGKLKKFTEFRSIITQSDEYLQSLLDGSEAEQQKNLYTDASSINKSDIMDLNSPSPSSSECHQQIINDDISILNGFHLKRSLREEHVAENEISLDQKTNDIETKNEFEIIEELLSDDELNLLKNKYNNISESAASRVILTKNEQLQANSSKSNSNDLSNINAIPMENKNPKEKSELRKPKSKTASLKCLECNKIFYKDYMLVAHKKAVHEGIDKPFSCEYCSSEFRLFQMLQRHTNAKHYSIFTPTNSTEHNTFESKQFVKKMNICLYCQRPFTRKDHLKEHIRAVHKGLRPFKCSICNKAFGSKNTQIRHERNHSSERPFACEFCGKRYNSERELNVHIQRHTTNPELLCPICKRGKNNLEELEKHIAMHELSRQHLCPKCGKVFTKLFHLREHDLTVHLKLRPFKCKHCEQTFGVRKTLRTHERSHDPTGRPETCLLCKLNFKNKRALSLHLKKIHATKLS